MSYITALYNQNTTTRVVGVTTATLAGSTAVYLTIPGWSSFATVNRLIVQASASGFTSGTPTISILTDGAAHRVSGSADPELYTFSLNSSNINNIVATNGAYIEDAHKTDCLYLLIASNSAFTTGTIFTVTAEGNAAQINNGTDSSQTTFSGDRSFRVLNVSTSATTDLTSFAQRNADPYLYPQGSINNSYQWTALGTSTDFLYVGSVFQLQGLMFTMAKASGLASNISSLAQYWNGTTWSTLTVQDNTSDGQSTPSGFSYSGTITLTLPSNWQLSTLATDPYTIYINSVITGNSQPPDMSFDPSRYWMRFSVPSLPSSLKLVALQPLAILNVPQ